jgi:hypothetical protein
LQAKFVAVDHHARLGANHFEEIQILRLMMRGGLVDLLGPNTDEINDVNTDEWIDMLHKEIQNAKQWTTITSMEYPIPDSDI